MYKAKIIMHCSWRNGVKFISSNFGDLFVPSVNILAFTVYRQIHFIRKAQVQVTVEYLLFTASSEEILSFDQMKYHSQRIPA